MAGTIPAAEFDPSMLDPSKKSVRQLRAWSAEMREVHRKLRAALELARQDDAAPPDTDPLLYCWGFCAALDGHHRSEDGALFPRVLAARPDLAPVVAQLVRDHHMIEHLIGELRRAMDRGAPAEEKLSHLDGISAIMDNHFRYEERRLLDVLDTLDLDDADPAELFGPLA